MIFKPVYAMTSDYLISWFYCIIQFGFKKNVRTERKRFRELVRKREKTTTTKQQQQTQTHKLSDITIFQIVLHYAFGEINHIIWHEGLHPRPLFFYHRLILRHSPRPLFYNIQETEHTFRPVTVMIKLATN